MEQSAPSRTDQSEPHDESTGMNTLLIGIDAGDLSVFDDLDESEEIPTIHRLCSEGASAPLESQIPPWTPSAWPSMYTGANPGKHGAFGFVGYDGYDWHVTSSDDVNEHTVWSLLDRHGYSSVVVNAPITHPPEAFDGALLPGFIGPENPDCHPDGLLEEVREAIGDYRVYPSYSRDDSALPDSEKMTEYRNLIRMRGAAFRYLAEEYDPDFGFVQFQKTDTVFHEFFGDEEKVRSVYETTDDEIAAILERFDPDHVFVASDHGMGEYEGYEFRVNEFLKDRGYVETTASGKGMPSWTPMRRKLREGEESETWEPSLGERAAAAVADRFGITARNVGSALERVGLAETVKKFAPDGVARTANEQVDFENSRAYVRARTELGVRINLEGRDPEGVVSADDYEQLREELIRELETVETPEGEPVFETVAPREQYFHGEYADDAVDVVTIPAEFDHAISEQLRGEYFAPAEPWNHKLNGVFAAAGDGVDEDEPLERAHLFDVAPTILASFDVPYSDRMDGSVIPVVDSAGSTSYPAYDESDANRTEAGEEVTERLADLGYMN
ncbi:alkaline phosphatase family protein [Natronococcus jeotgali]|uniref:Type I phosphodiesterase/nucleotide pyrophosphatase n=1 Tax=Natronococcus jeotgali DSM 18795 TaxID=1227498 RepID=L9XSK9_9EURY|nr:alkaline phosphatase family protein [Natronococcus jeotgali]ELY64794.1 type I phosphodiesterase/nucleotide pyrophosphatase [Natronococcus jeotgali DSM 18795]